MQIIQKKGWLMRTKKDFDKQNAYNREKYDHFNLMLPKGTKELWRARASAEGVSITEFVKKAVEYFIDYKDNENSN